MKRIGKGSRLDQLIKRCTGNETYVSIILFSASFTTNMSVFLPVARVAREDTTATSGDTVGESVQFVII